MKNAIAYLSVKNTPPEVLKNWLARVNHKSVEEAAGFYVVTLPWSPNDGAILSNMAKRGFIEFDLSIGFDLAHAKKLEKSPYDRAYFGLKN